MEEELHQLAKINVWHLVPRKAGRSIMGTMGVNKNKLDGHCVIKVTYLDQWFKGIIRKDAMIIMKPLALLQGKRPSGYSLLL